MNNNKPFPIRLGVMKPYLQKMAFDDIDSTGLSDKIKKILHNSILSDNTHRQGYLDELKTNKKLKYKNVKDIYKW